MTQRIRQSKAFHFHHIAIALLISFFIVLSAFSGVATAQNPVPFISQPLLPDAVKPGGAGFALTVNGTGFVPGSVVRWNGHARTTTFVSESRVKATILSSDLAKADTASVTVVNPGTGGGTSNVAFFEITAPSSSIGLTLSSSLDVGGTPTSVAVADFNRDGKLDLAVASENSNSISVLLGKGDGTFNATVHYGVGSASESVAVGDFNDDGKVDLAVADVDSQTVSVLLGNGDGTFKAADHYGAGSVPYSLAVGDFNADGKLDIAVTNNGSSNVSVLLGNGDGTFQAALDYEVGLDPTGVAAGDLNGDGKLDLVVVAFNSINVLLGIGDGTFKAAVDHLVGAGPLVVGDFNADGKLDLAVTNVLSSDVSVLLGNGDGTFRPAVHYGTGSAVHSLALGDFNGDSKLDLVVGDSDSSTAGVLLQVPSVSLSKTSLAFADQLIGTSSAAQTVVLTNGGLVSSIRSIAVTGANATDFSQTNTCSSSLAPGAKCNITVTFKPTKIGPRTASVTITDSAAGSPQAVALSGTGVISGPNATLSVASLSFSTQLVGTTSPAQSVKLSNYGTSVLSIASIVASGDFRETNGCGSSLAAGASCTISVTFKPTQTGSRTGTLSVTDNAPGSPQAVNLRGAGTIVGFAPASLNFGNVNIFGASTKTTKLTNTGSASLTITGITITGSSYFSQTNNCGTSVGAGKSCTITVTFAPKKKGTFSADVAVSDNGGGSPQQVPLSGTGISRGSAEMRSALGAYPTASVPSSTGPNNVGTRVVRLMDATRDDPYLANGKRELLVRFWYPASLNQGCEPAEYTSPGTWSYFSQLLGMPLPEVTTNSCLNARITDGAHPVIVFTHGYTGTFTDYTFIFEDLASRGYVVASVDHTYEATAVEFPDGRLVKSVLGSHLSGNLRGDDQAFALALSARLGDLKFVVTELERLNSRGDGVFTSRLDMSRIAVAGHSFGGLAALLALEQDPRFRGGVILDGIVEEASVTATDKPVLMLAAGRERWSEDECHLWNQLHGPRLAVNLKGAEHVTPSDAVWLAKGAVKTGNMGSVREIAAIRNYIAAFLDANFRGTAKMPVLAGPSSDYPDAAVTTQKQSLCGRP
jgi:predicted dienelactone hydrolase